MDPIRTAAVTRREALLSEAAKLTEFIQTYDDLAATQIVPVSDDIAPTSPAGSSPAVNPALQSLRSAIRDQRAEAIGRLRGWKTAETANLAAQIIRELGPRQTANLHAELLRRGHNVGGKSPTATLFSRLSRAELLEYDKLEGWRLSQAPRQTNETAGSELHPTPAVSGRDPDQPEGSSSYRAAVNPDGGGRI